MGKKQTELSEELREAVFEAARAGAAEAYTSNTGYVNYFKAMETLLYNYKKLAALVADGDKNAIKEYYSNFATLETLQTAIYKTGGWAFSFREYCKKYWVKTRYYGICEYYAPNKSAIYSVLGRYHVLKIVEV